MSHIIRMLYCVSNLFLQKKFNNQIEIFEMKSKVVKKILSRR